MVRVAQGVRGPRLPETALRVRGTAFPITAIDRFEVVTDDGRTLVTFDV
nr:hypothetical protein GCM10020093_075290 [Planobispora longispora]